MIHGQCPPRIDLFWVTGLAETLDLIEADPERALDPTEDVLGDLVRTAYAASKAAINALTLYVAAQYGKHGVRCNAISPGMVPTENSRKNQPDVIKMVVRHHLTPELGTPEDIAAMVALLSSADGRFITGQILRVDGGVTNAFSHVAENREQFESHVRSKWGVS